MKNHTTYWINIKQQFKQNGPSSIIFADKTNHIYGFQEQVYGTD